MVETIAQDVVSYIPSTTERKRAISSLFFVGIIMMLVMQKDLSVFERYYLALSLSLWSIGLITFLGAVLVFFLVSLLGYLYVSILLARFGLWGFSLWQARAGVYGHTFVPIRVLVGLGNRMLSLFMVEQTPSITSETSS